MEPAIARWDAAVAERVRSGASQADAIRQVVAADPQLHRDYLAAYNARGRRAEQPPSRQPVVMPAANVAEPAELLPPHRQPPVASSGGAAIEEWDRQVAAVMQRRGCSFQEATSTVAKEQPDLRQRYLADYAAASAAGLKPGARPGARGRF